MISKRYNTAGEVNGIGAFLAKTPLFSGLPENILAPIANLAHLRRFGRGEIIFQEDTEPDGFYIVRRGRVKVFKTSPEGKEQILHIFGPGQPFGEVAVFAGIGFPASSQAIEETEVVFISRREFTSLLKRDITIAMNMLAILSKRLRVFVRMIEDLSLKEVPGRLATYLLIEAQRHHHTTTVELDIPKAQLASLLGTIPETLSRIFKRLQSEGLIRVEGARITLLDRSGLEELSGLMDTGALDEWVDGSSEQFC